VRLIIARSSAWRETGATLAALRGLALARHLAATLEATAEVEVADRAYVDLVDRLNFRRASAVMLAADTAGAIARLRVSPADPLDWLRAAELAISLDRATEAIADPDLKAVAAARLAEVDAAAVSLASQPDTIDVARAWVRESARRAETLTLRYQARRPKRPGSGTKPLASASRHWPEQRSTATRLCALCCWLSWTAEARHARLAAEMLRGGQLHPDHAVELFPAARRPFIGAAGAAKCLLKPAGRPRRTVPGRNRPARRNGRGAW